MSSDVTITMGAEGKDPFLVMNITSQKNVHPIRCLGKHTIERDLFSATFVTRTSQNHLIQLDII